MTYSSFFMLNFARKDMPPTNNQAEAVVLLGRNNSHFCTNPACLQESSFQMWNIHSSPCPLPYPRFIILDNIQKTEKFRRQKKDCSAVIQLLHIIICVNCIKKVFIHFMQLLVVPMKSYWNLGDDHFNFTDQIIILNLESLLIDLLGARLFLFFFNKNLLQMNWWGPDLLE